MTGAEKLAMVKTILRLEDTSEDTRIPTYLDIAKREILSYRYSYGAVPDEPITDVPEEYEMTQIYAVVVGYGQQGAEGQTSHRENGVDVQFKFSDMIDYIRAHVVPIAKVVTFP